MRKSLVIEYIKADLCSKKGCKKEQIKNKPSLTLFLLNTTCPVQASSVDPDLLASEEAN